MIKELVQVTELLCDGYRGMPCGCEGCPLWDLEEYKKDEEHYKCDFYKILDTLKIS